MSSDARPAMSTLPESGATVEPVTPKTPVPGLPETQNPRAATASVRNANAVFIALTATNFFYYTGTYIAFAAVQSRAVTSAVDEVQMGWLVSAFFATTLAVRPFAPFLIKSAGAHVILIWGLVASAMACAILPSLARAPGVGAARAGHGAALVLFSVAITVLAVDHVAVARRGQALATFGASTNAAAAAGPAIGLWLIRSGELRAFGAATVAMLAAMGFAAPFCRRRDVRPEEPDRPKRSWRNLPQLMLASMVILVFGVTYSIHVGFIVAIAAAFRLPASLAGFYYSCYTAGIVASRLVGGRFSDGPGRRWLILSGSLAVSLALAGLGRSDRPILFLGSAAVYGIGAGLVHPGVLAWIVDLTAEHRGSGVTIFYCVFEAGIVIGGPVFGFVAARAGFSGALMAIAAAPAAAAFCAVGRLPPENPKNAGPWAAESVE